MASAGPERAEIARRVAARLGVDVEIAVTERGGHAQDLARNAVARGVRAVVAWGGDGTINEVASALAFGTVPLGIVPAGSGNGLARELRSARTPSTPSAPRSVPRRGRSMWARSKAASS